jgi:demethylmenaquinone methyltransferase/2-methoxy-6-polyprenyl-1,4-benzoquinol methylase
MNPNTFERDSKTTKSHPSKMSVSPLSKTTDSHLSNSTPDKSEFVKGLFGSISGTYDKANDVITFGMARLWRNKLVELSEARAGDHILDCATGTGDLALAFKRKVGESGRVVGTDFCGEMLALAPEKAKAQNLNIDFELGDVLALKYADNTFDITSIAYGIRNVANVAQALKEMARVTTPGGRVMILETGDIENPVLRTGIRFYFEHVVPRLGGWVSGKPEAYEYLQSSSGAFPSKEDFCLVLKAVGCFSDVSCTTLMGGASYIYKCVVK